MASDTLAHEAAIRQLTAFYSDAINHHDPVRAASVYAMDGTLLVFDGPDIIGRPAIFAAIEQSVSPLLFVHQVCHSGLIQVDGTRARARWSVYEIMRRSHEDGLAVFAGTYEDELVQLSEGWRFSRRHLRAALRAMLDVSRSKLFPHLDHRHEFPI